MNYKNSILGGAIAFIIATSCCWLPALIIAIGGGSTLLAFSDGLEKSSGIFIAIGLGLLGFGAYQYRRKINQKSQVNPIIQSTITCPECNYVKEETMPTNACQYFYECEKCNTMLKPLSGDCCVYCSFGNVACPPIQMNENCC